MKSTPGKPIPLSAEEEFFYVIVSLLGDLSNSMTILYNVIDRTEDKIVESADIKNVVQASKKLQLLTIMVHDKLERLRNEHLDR